MINLKSIITAAVVIGVIVLFGCKEEGFQEKAILPPKSDSVKKLIKTLNESSNTKAEKKKILDFTYSSISRTMDNDTLKAEFLSKIAYQYYKIGDFSLFKKSNKEAFELASKLKDSLIIADTYWHYANYYKKRDVLDSAYSYYYAANKCFESLGQDYLSAKMLYSMGYIKNRYRDYLGSEVLIIKAIKAYKKHKVYKSLYSSYSLLSTNYKELKDFERARFYRSKAWEYLTLINDQGTLKEGNLNNLGLIYTEEGKYENAIREYNRALSRKDLKYKNPNLYARLTDNLAYTKLLKGDYDSLEDEFHTALKIREKMNSKTGIVVSKIHLSDYYNEISNTTKAIKYALEANTLAKTIKANDDFLKSLNQLSKLDKKKSNQYLVQYIKFSDSLTNVERKIRNQFARIDYETDEYIEENKRLGQQKVWLLFSSFGILLTVSLFFYANIQKTKNKSLMLQAEQQHANEHIYILTIRQQNKIEEELIKERNRLAEDLHDGVLGKLFGTRVGLGFLNVEGDEKTLQQFESFQAELQEIEKEIREVSHDLKGKQIYDQVGFVALVNKLIENRSKIGNFTYKVGFSKYTNWNKIEEHIRVNLYRILQEGLKNIIKYAKADLVKLKFDVEDENIVMTITDNGVGFSVKKAKEGIGLMNMDSRMNRLQGKFEITSKPNKGTTIKCMIPLKNINYERQDI